MLFAILCDDKPGHLELRKKTRADHLAYLDSLGDALKFAGPFLDNNNDAVGSLVMVDAQNRLEAEKIAENDPYAKAGLFSSVTVRPWSWAVKNPDTAK